MNHQALLQQQADFWTRITSYNPFPFSDASVLQAQALLRRLLTPRQWEQAQATGYFCVEHRRWGLFSYRYMLHIQYYNVVWQIKRGGIVLRRGVWVRDNLPTLDHVIAHKVALEAEGDHYLRRAHACCSLGSNNGLPKWQRP